MTGQRHTVPLTGPMMDMIDQSPSLFNQDISQPMDEMGMMGKVGVGVGVKAEGGGELEALYSHI